MLLLYLIIKYTISNEGHGNRKKQRNEMIVLLNKVTLKII